MTETPKNIKLRQAGIEDLELLLHWDRQEHVRAAVPDDYWEWETEIPKKPWWREQLIAERDNRPFAFVQIIDPAFEETRYWGDVPEGLRAVDIWIGEKSHLGKGYGTTVMKLALERCFSAKGVEAVLIDPLLTNVRAHRFYSKLGFVPVEKRIFGKDECLVFRLTRDHWKKTAAG